MRQNLLESLHFLKCSPTWLSPPRESLGYTPCMGVQPLVQPMFLRSTYRITKLEYTMGASPCVEKMLVTSSWRMTVLHYTYACATLSAAYLCILLQEDHCVTLHLWVGHLQCSRWWLSLPRELLGYTAHMGAQV